MRDSTRVRGGPLGVPTLSAYPDAHHGGGARELVREVSVLGHVQQVTEALDLGDGAPPALRHEPIGIDGGGQLGEDGRDPAPVFGEDRLRARTQDREFIQEMARRAKGRREHRLPGLANGLIIP